MSITAALKSAGSGLAATARQAEVLSGNIANALTEGYARREVTLAQQAVGGGVIVTGVRRADDPAITRSARDAAGRAAEADVRATLSARLARAAGTPGNGDDIGARADALVEALRNLAETPESATLQDATVSEARTLTGTITALSQETTRVRRDADAEIAKKVAEVNSALAKLERINREVRLQGVRGADTSALLDQRDRLVDQISSNIPIRASQDDDGTVRLTTPQGATLFDGRAGILGFTRTPSFGPEASLAGGQLSGLTLNGRDITPGGPSTAAPTGGGIAALFAMRDREAPAVSSRLDRLAADLIDRTRDPSLPAGEPGLFTDAGALPGTPPSPGLAARLAVNDALMTEPWRLRDGLGAAAPGATGDATRVRGFLDALTALREGSDGVGRSFAESATSVSGAGASSAAEAADARDGLAAEAATLADLRGRATGVDSDAELQALIVVERAYAANARVIDVSSRMIDTLLQMG